MDFALADMAYPVLVVALGYVALGLTGFASALISVPLLAWRWPLVEVVPLVLVMDVTASFLMGGLNLREVRWGELRHLGPGMLLGGLLGLWLAARVTSAVPLLVLGAYVAGVGFQALRQRTAPAQAPPAPRPGIGGLYGVGIRGEHLETTDLLQRRRRSGEGEGEAAGERVFVRFSCGEGSRRGPRLLKGGIYLRDFTGNAPASVRWVERGDLLPVEIPRHQDAKPDHQRDQEKEPGKRASEKGHHRVGSGVEKGRRSPKLTGYT